MLRSIFRPEVVTRQGWKAGAGRNMEGAKEAPGAQSSFGEPAWRSPEAAWAGGLAESRARDGGRDRDGRDDRRRRHHQIHLRRALVLPALSLSHPSRLLLPVVATARLGILVSPPPFSHPLMPAFG